MLEQPAVVQGRARLQIQSDFKKALPFKRVKIKLQVVSNGWHRIGQVKDGFLDAQIQRYNGPEDLVRAGLIRW